ncbi:MAG: response regulator [Gemmatimonadales bacterium]
MARSGVAHGIRNTVVLALALVARAPGQAPVSDTTFASLPDTAKVLRLNAQSWELRRNDQAAAIAVGQRSLQLARQIGFRRGEAQALNFIGVEYQWLGENRQASRHFFLALGVADSAKIALEKGYALNNIASLLLLDGDAAKALDYAERALAVQKETGDSSGLAYVHVRLSEVYNFLKRYDEAIAEARTASAYWSALHRTASGLTALRSVAIAYEGKGDYQRALNQLLAIVSSDSIPRTIRLHDYNDLARVYLELNQPDKAIAIGLEKVAGGEGDVEIMRHLATAYAAKGDWPKAYRYSARGTAVQDSVENDERFRILKNLQIIYETNQTEAENQTLRDRLRVSRYAVLATAAGLLLAFYVGLSLFLQRRRQAGVNGLLAGQLAQIRTSEAALAESVRRQRAILDNVSDLMWVKDVEGRYTAVNDAFCRFVQRRSDEIEGHTNDELGIGDRLAALPGQTRNAIDSRSTISVDHEHDVEGVARVMETTVSPVFAADGAVVGTIGMARDITERKRTDAHLRRAQKLESLSVLAGGIAHDFNNLLLGVIGNASFARDELPANSPVLDFISEIEFSAHRAAELSRQMLAYTGKADVDRQQLHLSVVVAQAVDATKDALPPQATLHTDLATNVPLILGDAEQIGRVVGKLLKNAAEALGDRGGSITVRTARVQISTADIARLDIHGTLTEGDYVVVEVNDTGEGMTPETVSRIFDPFFTTRFVGRGLGLAAALGMMRGHHGGVQVESELGVGSTFRAYFPAVAAPAPAAGGGAENADAERSLMDRGADLILVVDDEAVIRAIAKRVLERAGFQVMTAVDGQDGVELFQQHLATVALVVMDLVMPRLDGEQAMAAMRTLRSDIPFVVISGFSSEMVHARVRERDRVDFLSKPFLNSELLEAIRQLLEQSRAV